MSAALRRALGPHAIDGPDGLWVSPGSDRQLAEVFQVLAAEKARLFRDVKLSRAGLSALGPVESASGVMAAGAGVMLATVEATAREQGFSLGPLSPGALTLSLGDFLEGPYAGLRSIPGGRLEPITLGLKAVLPDGKVVRSHLSPRSAAGPDLVAMFLGGSARLGVITEAWVRLFPMPAARRSASFSFPSVKSLEQALLAALADGCWLEGARVSRRGERAMLEVTCVGSADGVERDFATLSRRVFPAGGRASGPVSGEWAVSAQREQASANAEVEASWPAILEALNAGQALSLHRVSLSSAIAEGGVAGVALDQPAAWPLGAGMIDLLDPNFVLGGPL